MRKIFSFFPILILIVFVMGLVAFNPQSIEIKHPFFQILQEKLSQKNEELASEKVYLQFDRTQYKPGEDIWFKAYLRDANNLKPSLKSGILHVELLNPQGAVIQKRTLIANSGGAAGDFNIGAQLAGGIYKIKAYTNWQKNTNTFFEREIQVQKAVLPNLKMKLDFERKAFGAGDKVVAKLDLHSLSNKALSNYRFNYIVQLNGRELLKNSAKTSALGRSYIQFNLPENLNSNDGLLNVMIHYNGQNESISRSIPIVLNDIDLQFFPEGGDAVAGITNRLAFKSLDEFGKPADVEGFIYDAKNQIVANFKTYHQGMGAIDFTPEKGQYYKAKVTKPTNLEKVFDIPKIKNIGASLKIDAIHKENLAVSIQSTSPATYYLVARSRDVIQYKTVVQLKKGIQSLEIPTQKFPIGITQLSLFDENEIPVCERLVFINSDKKLYIELSTNKEKYLPREEVEMRIRVKDEKGNPIAGNFSLVVADDKLLTFADDKQGHILSHMLLESELKGEVVEPNFYFEKQRVDDLVDRKKALDLLMLTQGWRRYNWQEVLQENLVNIQFPAETGNIKGVIHDRSGNAIPHAKLRLPYHDKNITVDENGVFEFQGIDLYKQAKLEIRAAGYHSLTTRIKDYNTDLKFVLKEKTHVIRQSKFNGNILEGQIIDDETGESIPFATVNLIKDDMVVNSTTSNMDGYYHFSTAIFSDITFAVAVNYVGYPTTKIADITLENNQTAVLNISVFPSTVSLDAVVVKSYKIPLIEQDNATVGQRLTSASVQKRQLGILKNKDKRSKPKSKQEIQILNQFDAIKRPLPPPPLIEEIPEEEIEEKEIEFIDDIVELEEDVIIEPPAIGDVVPPPPPPPPMEEEVREIFMITEEIPRFKCEECELLPTKNEIKQCASRKMLDFIYDHLKYPRHALDACIEGTVVVRFTVDENGEIIDPKVIRDIGGGLGKEALKIVEKMPAFVPGKQRGRAVKVQYNMPVKFTLTTDQRMPKTEYVRSRQFYAPKYTTTKPIDIRTDFRSTIFWEPNIELDASGTTTIKFYNSDDISAFRVTMEGFGVSGEIGRAEYKYFTQMPFNMIAKVPNKVLTGDRVKIPLTLSNNTTGKLGGKLKIKAPNNFKLLSKIPSRQFLEAEENKTLFIEYLVLDELTEEQFSIAYDAQGITDKFTTNIKTKSRGFPINTTLSGKQMQEQFDIDIREPVEGSIRCKLTFHPDALTEVMTGMEKMLRLPRGCFEQTSSTNYPNLLVLDYLKSTNSSNPEMEEKAIKFLKNGYSKLTGYESPSGGFEWWGRDPGHEALTAYGLMQFVDMKSVFSVDEKMIDRTANWLLKKRNDNDGWNSSEKGLHRWASNGAVKNAYIVWALTEAGYANEIRKEIENSYKDALESKDMYIIGLIANTLLKTKDKRVNSLLKLAAEHQDDKGFWKGNSASITNSKGLALQIETTSLISLAMMHSTQYKSCVKKAMAFISQSKTSYGFGNTQSTVLALKAILAFAKESAKSPESGKINLFVDGELVKEKTYSKNQKGKIEIKNVEQFLKNGQQKIELKFADTKTPLHFEIDLQYATKLPESKKSCAIKMETNIASNQIKMGETVRLTSQINNITDIAVASPLVMVGIPAGLSPQAWQLKELQDKKVVDYYELFDGFVVFHFEGMNANEKRTVHLDLKADVPGTYEAPASSAFLYYTNDTKSWSMPEAVVIAE